jgi:hypothetical protein
MTLNRFLTCGIAVFRIVNQKYQKYQSTNRTVTRAFQRVKELSFGACHEKAKCVIGFYARCLFGRLARAMMINVIFLVLKVNINV